MFIDTLEGLTRLCEQLADSSFLAVDTEFVRERTYFPRLCLIQIANEELHACIDPLALSDLDPLLNLLYRPDLTKVLHAARQDLEIFFQLHGSTPAPLFDTQIASDLAGLGEQISYATMVSELLGISLSKTQTRTNWANRPLSDSQLTYAADDVRHLVSAYHKLKSILEDRFEWVLEDSSALNNPHLYESPIASAHQRVKGASRLFGQHRLVLREIATWREQMAIRKDLPRRWVMEDKTLLAIAQTLPDSEAVLASLEGLSKKTLQRYGAQLLEIVVTVSDNQETDPQQPLKKTALSPSERNQLKAMQRVVDQCSERHNISASLLASRKELIQILHGDTDSKSSTGWRWELIGQELQEIAKE